MHRVLVMVIIIIFNSSGLAWAIGTSFTYQGQLEVSSVNGNGAFDFEFDLYDAKTNGTLIAGPVALDGVSVSDGIFSVDLDFGVDAFDGSDRWLEIRVKRSSDGVLTLLNPRQAVNATPYAIRAESSAFATAASAAATSESTPWIGITGIPAGLDDGDDDTLGFLACADGEVAVLNGSAWVCGSVTDGTPEAVCMDSSGVPGLLIDGICLLGYDNSATASWNTAASACSAMGGDLCTASQYDGLRGEGVLQSTSDVNDLFAFLNAVWSEDFSDNDGGSKTLQLRSSDDPNVAQSYSYGCCGNVLPEPFRSQATDVNGVLVTYVHTAEDTSWRAAARVCRTRGSDLCTKSQYVALNDTGLFGPTVRRATPELSDNDGSNFANVIGTNASDNGSISQDWAYGCCSTARPVDNSCPGTLISGICVVENHDVEDSTFEEAALACASQGADICSKSEMQTIRNFGQFAGECWTHDGADNDSKGVGGLLGTQPDNPDPATDLMGYVCCL